MSEQVPHTSKPPRVIHHEEVMPEEHPERHEHTDVSVRGIWITVGAIVLTTLVVMVIMYVVFFAYERAQAAQDQAERRSAIQDTLAGPPEDVPRLQGIEGYNAATPSSDMIQMDRETESLVEGYGKTPDGRIRIPVNKAMEIALKQNLFPVREGAGTAGSPATRPRNASTQPSGGGHDSP